MKLIVLLVVVLLLTVFVSGCTTSTERTHGALTTEKTTTKITPGGIEKDTKTCPFWDRDC